MKISISDRVIELEKCGHCGAIPTEADASAALRHEIECAQKCAICGQDIKLSEMKLSHHYYGGEHRWLLDGKREPAIDISHYGGDCWVRAPTHVSCFKKVAPGAQVTPH